MAFRTQINFPVGSCTFTVVNPRLIVMTPIIEGIEEIVNDKIVRLHLGEPNKIEIGQTLKLGKQKYKIQEITKDPQGLSGPGFYLHTQVNITKTSNFLLPLLGGTRNDFRWESSFMNSFIGTEDEGDWATKLYLMYRFDGSKAFLDFEDALMQHPWYVGKKDVDGFHTLYIFEFPESIKEEIELIVTGKYSKIKEETKKRILDFHYSNKNRPIGQVLYKDVTRRLQMEKELEGKIPEDNELLDPFHVKDELFFNQFIIADEESERCNFI